MQTLSEMAASKLPGNHKAIGRLVVLFDRHYRSIELMISKRDVRLVTPSALAIIMEETGLTEAEVLTEKEEVKLN